jgi:hypothetical protein
MSLRLRPPTEIETAGYLLVVATSNVRAGMAMATRRLRDPPWRCGLASRSASDFSRSDECVPPVANYCDTRQNGWGEWLVSY